MVAHRPSPAATRRIVPPRVDGARGGATLYGASPRMARDAHAGGRKDDTMSERTGRDAATRPTRQAPAAARPARSTLPAVPDPPPLLDDRPRSGDRLQRPHHPLLHQPGDAAARPRSRPERDLRPGPPAPAAPDPRAEGQYLPLEDDQGAPERPHRRRDRGDCCDDQTGPARTAGGAFCSTRTSSCHVRERGGQAARRRLRRARSTRSSSSPDRSSIAWNARPMSGRAPARPAAAAASAPAALSRSAAPPADRRCRAPRRCAPPAAAGRPASPW